MINKWTLGLVPTLLVLGSVNAHAQDDLLDDLYGRGVHAYFACKFQDSWQKLTDAISQGSRDPRAFYFRGLALKQLGRSYEAETDFRMGAEIEATANAVFPIGRSLARIQGAERIQLEEYRRKARLNVRGQRNVRERARYEDLKRNEGGVLRGGGILELPNQIDSGDTTTNPFADENGMSEGAPVDAPPKPDPGSELEPLTPATPPADGGGDAGNIFGDAMDDTKPATPPADAGGGAAPNPFE